MGTWTLKNFSPSHSWGLRKKKNFTISSHVYIYIYIYKEKEKEKLVTRYNTSPETLLPPAHRCRCLGHHCRRRRRRRCHSSSSNNSNSSSRSKLLHRMCACRLIRETCLAGKTNLPVDIRAESQKIAVWVKIGTALPCTTPRPAPKSSTDDLACDLWEERRRDANPTATHFGWVEGDGSGPCR